MNQLQLDDVTAWRFIGCFTSHRQRQNKSIQRLITVRPIGVNLRKISGALNHSIGARGCMGTVREGVAPSRDKGPGVSRPGNMKC